MKRARLWLILIVLSSFGMWNVVGCSNPPTGEEPGVEATTGDEGSKEEQGSQESQNSEPTTDTATGPETAKESAAPENGKEPQSEPATPEPADEPGDEPGTPEPGPEAGPETRPEPKPEPAVEMGPEAKPDTSGPATCNDVKDAYNKLVKQTQCSEASDCHVVTGYCGMGLGGCWHITSTKLSQADLKALLTRWQSLQCRGPVCSCLPPPKSVTCVSGVCAAGKANSCDSVRSGYNTLIQNNRSCKVDTDCHILTGHCGVGLGGCYYATNVSLTQSQLDKLKTQWTTQKCTGPVCRCAAPPAGAKCDAGVCVTK